MCPWTYEKSLILLKEFGGEQVLKDISLWQSPFWVQIHNLLLKSRTREMRRAIGTKLGEVLDVDVSESGVNWGKFLRVRHRGRREEKLQGLVRRKEGPIRGVRCVNRRDVKRRRNIRRTKIGRREICPSQQR